MFSLRVRTAPVGHRLLAVPVSSRHTSRRISGTPEEAVGPWAGFKHVVLLCRLSKVVCLKRVDSGIAGKVFEPFVYLQSVSCACKLKRISDIGSCRFVACICQLLLTQHTSCLLYFFSYLLVTMSCYHYIGRKTYLLKHVRLHDYIVFFSDS
jgi:hypothetical protein